MTEKNIYRLFILILVIIFFGIYFVLKLDPFSQRFDFYLEKPIKTHEDFRSSVIDFAVESASRFIEEKDINYPNNLEIHENWNIQVSLYLNGEEIGKGEKGDNTLSHAINGAVKNALSENKKYFSNKEKIENVFFLIKVYSPSVSFIFSGNVEGSYDILDEKKIITAVYDINKSILKNKIEESKKFLLSIEHPLENGFYKYYLPREEKEFEDRLHTTYSASIIYSLLFVYEFDKDEAILKKLSDWGSFLLKMQTIKEGDRRHGAFVYSYFFEEKGLDWGSKIKALTINSEGKIYMSDFYIDDKGRELRYVIGTNSKTIFTLLRLYEYTKEEKYLESAKLAGNWLLTMQNEDGTMKPYSRYRDGKWFFGTKESLLYQGQVISAFSRLYEYTKEEKYLKAAEKIVNRFIYKIEESEGNFIVDDYREVNSISNSWVVMSLMDFYLLFPNDYYKGVIFNHSKKIIEEQLLDEKDLFNFGRYKTAFSTSGNGWIAEVLTEVYRFCLKEGENIDCEKYKDSAIKAIRWVIQYTYSKENTFHFKNLEKVIGGTYWSRNYMHIRTDSVAHSLNSYTRIIEYLTKENVISLPKPEFNTFLFMNDD